MNTEKIKQPEPPSRIYILGLNLIYLVGDIFIKSVATNFLWNNGIIRIHHSIPKLDFITCLSILCILSIIGRILGAAFMETFGVRFAVLQQNLSITKQTFEKKDENTGY